MVKSLELLVAVAKDGVLDVYTVEGNPEVWYAEADADKTPIIVSAGFEDTTKKILFKASQAVDTSDPQAEGKNYKVTDLDGKSYQEIAKNLDRHVKSIDNALQRVKHKLEKLIRERNQ